MYLPKEPKRPERKPDYFKILAAPIMIVGMSIFTIAMMDPPLWAILGFVGLSAMMIVAAYAYLDMEKKENLRIKKYGAGAGPCDICGAKISALEYDNHLWRHHFYEARAMKRLMHQMLWWVLGITGASGAVMFALVGLNIASLIVFALIGPLLGLVIALGMTLQVRWPRVAARARKEWLETHPGWNPENSESVDDRI